MPNNRNPNNRQCAPNQQKQKGESEITVPKLNQSKIEREKTDNLNDENKGAYQNVADKPYRPGKIDKILVWFDLKKQLLTVSLPITLSFVILIVTIAQSCIYQRQLDAMNKQVDLMNKQVEIQSLAERPYIVVKSATIPNLVPTQPVNAVITIANRGRTPAQDLNITIEVAATPNTIYALGFPDTGARPADGLFLAAGDEISLENAPADAVTLNADYLSDVLNGKNFLMIHGKGTYKNLADIEFPVDEYCFYFSRHKQFIQCSPEMYGANNRDKPTN